MEDDDRLRSQVVFGKEAGSPLLEDLIEDANHEDANGNDLQVLRFSDGAKHIAGSRGGWLQGKLQGKLHCTELEEKEAKVAAVGRNCTSLKRG